MNYSITSYKNGKPEPIRILCVFSLLDRGGAESMCMNLYRKIDRTTVQFDFVKHTKDKGAFEDEIISLGGRIFTAPRFRGSNLIEYKTWWKRHLSAHPEHQIIHGHYYSVSSIYFSVAKQMNRITIGHSHIAKYDSVMKHIMCKRVERFSDYCFACGREAGQLLYKHRHFIILNNAIETEKFKYDAAVRESSRDHFGFSEDDLVIGIVANFGEHKNPIGVVDIFKAVLDRKPQSYLFWVGDGSQRSLIENRAKELKITDRVCLLGVRTDVQQLLQAMDAFILPSFYEGLPVVLIEAQAAGLQCFASTSVTSEADITGRCQFLPLDDYSLWADRILKTDLTHVDTTEQIKAAGYDIQTTAKWLQQFYLTLAENAENGILPSHDSGN